MPIAGNSNHIVKTYEKWVLEKANSISYRVSLKKGVSTQERIDYALSLVAETLGITRRKSTIFLLEESREFITSEDVVRVFQGISQKKFPKNLGIIFRRPVESVRRLRNLTLDISKSGQKS